MLANGIDRLTGWSDNERVAFMSGTTKGLLRGAFLGLVVGVVAIASFPVITAAVLGNAVLLGGAAVGAAAFGMYEGQKSLDSYLYGQKKRLSDSIAERSGAVPREQPPIKTPNEIEAEQQGKSTFFQDSVKKSRESSAGINR